MVKVTDELKLSGAYREGEWEKYTLVDSFFLVSIVE